MSGQSLADRRPQDDPRPPIPGRGKAWNVLAALALVVLAALHYTTIPGSLWEFDECLFAAGVERYEPLRHHPPPPGYPLYIGFAQVVALFATDAFAALIVTSVLAVAAGLVAFLLAFTEITGDRRSGLVATLLLHGSPALWISGVLPQSDAGAFALLGLAIFTCTRAMGRGAEQAGASLPLRTVVLYALPPALCIGWRLQLSIAVVPMFLTAVWMMRTWRDRIAAITVFTAGCLAWFVPLVIFAGGPDSFWAWLSGQAAYFAQHDSDLSRSGQGATQIALRFIAHPWGPKWLSLPFLAVAIAGAVRTGRRTRRIVPLAVGCLAYLAMALATMDPADAVRYAMPALPLIALLAAIGLTWPLASESPKMRGLESIITAVVVLYVAGAGWYALPVLQARATSIAPPAAAVRWIERHAPRNAVILYDAPLWPHATYLLRDWKTMRVDAGLARYGGDPAVPLILLADGERAGIRGVTWHWPDTDAYRKLTRQHYGAVSVMEVPPAERYRVVEGVYAPERTRDGRSWRWIGDKAVIEFPALGATHVRLSFRTPPEYPLTGNRINVNGQTVTVTRNESVDVTVPLQGTRVTLIPEQTFVPARVRGANNRDARTLSVMLTRAVQFDPRPDAAGSPPRQ